MTINVLFYLTSKSVLNGHAHTHTHRLSDSRLTTGVLKMSFHIDAETRMSMLKRKKLEKNFSPQKVTKKVKTEKIAWEEDENHEGHNTLDLACLFSPNWLNDEVINQYMKLLNSVDNEVFMFTTYFYNTFSTRGFEAVENYYRRYNIFSYKTILIPVHHRRHWFLITYNGDKLESYDPLIYPGETLEESYQLHLQILTDIKDKYWKQLFQKYDKPFNEPSIIVHLPPTIPLQDNGYDCGVFLLSFAKCIVFGQSFNFGTDDMIQIRDTIRAELQTGQIHNIEQRSSDIRTKRKRSRSKDIPVKKKKIFYNNEQRRIINPDAQTCWLNSCLQLVLTALDHKDNIDDMTSYGSASVLWDQLIWLQGKDPSVILDPTDIKNVLIQKERERISRGNVSPHNMLFDLGNLQIMYDNNGDDMRVNRIGQQDCKDFFYCLDENRESWHDVFNLFKINTLSMTECASCSHVSRQEISGPTSTIIELDCPTVSESMKHYVENKMNGYEEYNGWRDEEGCGKVTVGKSSTRIENIEDAEYIVFVLKRLIQVQNQRVIIQTEVSVDVNDRVNLTDVNGRTAQFEPISIIHHIGHVIGNTTQGHYLADVKNKVTNSWFRTSDNAPPEDITEIGLTKMGYIFLYKKTSL